MSTNLRELNTDSPPAIAELCQAQLIDETGGPAGECAAEAVAYLTINCIHDHVDRSYVCTGHLEATRAATAACMSCWVLLRHSHMLQLLAVRMLSKP